MMPWWRRKVPTHFKKCIQKLQVFFLGNNVSLCHVNLLVCDTGLPVPDMVTVVKPDDVELVAWFIVRGTDTPGGGWSGSTEDRSFLGTLVDMAELLSELVPSLSFVDGTVGWVTWCFCKFKQCIQCNQISLIWTTQGQGRVSAWWKCP